ncbi:hypothetical protein OL548_33850 (plasmid) [Lysinibacillus sp. MHQ-1]|nr:hypothetical protein OL548_33850 [Lysinibacillus sp. MHQ-1]
MKQSICGFKKNTYDDSNIALASLVGCTDVAKRILLEKVESSSFPHWPAGALIEGWGIHDNNVASTLATIINGADLHASKIGHLIPEIIQDKDKARRKLMELIKSKSKIRLDFVLMGLENVWDISIENNIKEHLLNVVSNFKDDDSLFFNNRNIALNFFN